MTQGDLSRFGRNFLEAVYYIEKIFPFLGVRLIAVTDHFDSKKQERLSGLDVSLHMLVNEMYSKDISKKVWTSLQQKKSSGYAVGMAAPYGYIRNRETKRNEIDPETAFFVQMMFMWAASGVPIARISRRLHLLGAPTPRQRLYQLGVIKREKEWVWGSTAIRNILSNQTYVGDTVSNKTNQALFAGQEKTRVPKEEWIITSGTHPAIIARDDFEEVQEILNEHMERHHKARNATKQINERLKDDLPEMVFCADCGARMVFDRVPHGAAAAKKVGYYICKGRDLDLPCLGHQITEQLLKMLVMDQIRIYLRHLCDGNGLSGDFWRSADDHHPVSDANSRFCQLNAKAGELADKRRKLYEDYIAGVVDADEYQKIRERYLREFEQCRKQLEEVRVSVQEAEAKVLEYKKMAQEFKKYQNVCAFDAELVKSLVERVEVGRDKRLHLVYKFTMPPEEWAGRKGALI